MNMSSCRSHILYCLRFKLNIHMFIKEIVFVFGFLKTYVVYVYVNDDRK